MRRGSRAAPINDTIRWDRCAEHFGMLVMMMLVRVFSECYINIVIPFGVCMSKNEGVDISNLEGYKSVL